jgi:hypothetical protein
VPLLNSLATIEKLIQVTSTATKHANKSFLSRIGGFFLHISLGFEGWLWIGCAVGFGWFECFLLFVVVGARNKLKRTLLTLFLTSLKPNTNLYVDLVALSSTQLKSSSIIFSLKTVSSRRAVKLAISYFSSMFSLVAWKSLPLREPHTTNGGDKIV